MSVEDLEEEQFTHIRPSGAWPRIDLGELWAYRELLYFLTLRDVKVRYKQTAIGVLWAVLQPVATTAIFAVIFSQVTRFDSVGLPYPLYVLSGMLLWLFANNAITFSSNSLVGSSTLVTKIYFPRLLMPLAAVLAGLIDLSLGLVILLIAMFAYGIAPSIQILWAPVFIVWTIFFTLGVGTFFSAVNVKFRDVKFILPFLLQIWMFASPVFYPLDILSSRARLALALNPMSGILAGFRYSLFGQEPDWSLVGISAAMTALLIVGSFFVFKQMEDDFADFI